MEKQGSDFGEHRKEEYIIPDELLREIDTIDEEKFWHTDYLSKQFDEDVAFGTKMWGGMYEILIESGVSKKALDVFNDKTDVLILSNTKPDDAAEYLLDIRKWVSQESGVSLSTLTAKDILRRAYIGEAKSMKEVGIDPEINPPFSFSLGLNKDHPLVQEVLEKDAQHRLKDGSEILERLMEKTPSLKRKMEQFVKDTRPLDDQS